MKYSSLCRRTSSFVLSAALLCFIADAGSTLAATKQAKKETKKSARPDTAKVEKKEENPIFFPLPPDPPRVQFLMSFSTSADLPNAKPSKFSTFLTGKEPPSEMIIKPYGLAIRHGKIEVTDTVLNSIRIVDLEKWSFRSFSPKGEGLIRVPINLSIDQDGTHYVADTGRRQVVIFDQHEKYLGAIGTKDEMKPTDVAISGDRLYVTDLKAPNVRVYDKKERKLLFTIPRGRVTETNQLFSPTNLALDSQGNLYVSDTGAFRVLKFDPEGNYLQTFAKHGGDPGTLARPKGVAVDREGRDYVVDAATQVLQLWDAQGRLLLFFGEPVVSPIEFNIPSKVVVDYDHVALFKKFVAPGFKVEHLIFVVSQYGDRKVSVFGFGSKES